MTKPKKYPDQSRGTQVQRPAADAGVFLKQKGVKLLMGIKKSRTLRYCFFTALTAVILLIFGPAAFAEDLLQESARINEGCLRCHGAQGLKTKFVGEAKPTSLYVDEQKYSVSMHGTMPCTYCHTNINDYPHVNAPTERKALVSQVNTECRRCHKDITPMYNNSVHGRINPDQGKVNAYCSDCHGVHNIYKKEVAAATINHNQVPHTCARCHEELMHQYELDFHAKSVLLGGKEAASCVSCHGSHTILGPEEKASTVSKENTPKTCAKCHLFPLKNFANGKMHYKLEPTGDGAVSFWTLEFFTWLTIGTISFVLVLILLELRRKWIDAGKPDIH